MDSWEKMLSRKEVAGYFGISRDTVRRLIGRGVIRTWRMPQPSGRRKRVYVVDRIPESEAVRVFKAYFGK